MDNPCKAIAEFMEMMQKTQMIASGDLDTEAEKMLYNVRRFKQWPSDQVLRTTDDMRGVEAMALALKFSRLRPAIILQAIVEDWSRDRIIREVHC